MSIVTSSIYHDGDGEAVRLPDEVAFGDEIDVTVVGLGDVSTIYPKRPSVAEMIAKLRTLPGPGEIEVRDTDIIPERPGL